MKITTKVHLGSRCEVCSSTIVYLKAEGNYTRIYFNDGNTLLSSTTLGTLEQRLAPYNFFRANRSTVVNLNCLDKILVYAEECELLNKQNQQHSIRLSRRRAEAFYTHVN